MKRIRILTQAMAYHPQLHMVIPQREQMLFDPEVVKVESDGYSVLVMLRDEGAKDGRRLLKEIPYHNVLIVDYDYEPTPEDLGQPVQPETPVPAQAKNPARPGPGRGRRRPN